MLSRLAEAVIDLVRSCVIQIFPLQVDLPAVHTTTVSHLSPSGTFYEVSTVVGQSTVEKGVRHSHEALLRVAPAMTLAQ